ncbi:MAG: hypothetical protein VKI63_02610 [Cyanobium sp.]|nr:hypothetical protein [Cyanobium sp.]
MTVFFFWHFDAPFAFWAVLSLLMAGKLVLQILIFGTFVRLERETEAKVNE